MCVLIAADITKTISIILPSPREPDTKATSDFSVPTNAKQFCGYRSCLETTFWWRNSMSAQRHPSDLRECSWVDVAFHQDECCIQHHWLSPQDQQQGWWIVVAGSSKQYQDIWTSSFIFSTSLKLSVVWASDHHLVRLHSHALTKYCPYVSWQGA